MLLFLLLLPSHISDELLAFTENRFFLLSFIFSFLRVFWRGAWMLLCYYQWISMLRMELTLGIQYQIQIKKTAYQLSETVMIPSHKYRRWPCDMFQVITRARTFQIHFWCECELDKLFRYDDLLLLTRSIPFFYVFILAKSQKELFVQNKNVK